MFLAMSNDNCILLSLTVTSVSMLMNFLIIRKSALIYTYWILLFIKISAEPFKENECFLPTNILVRRSAISSDNW